ncbi:MAG: zinc ribbon domain-containing protein [Desulfosarcinaceae bacterium]|nr:zinc ribbon domain-containing protein [Desulfosarcinaceae bacterium]
MPNLEYTCPRCGHRFRRIIMRGDPPAAAACPACRLAAVPPAQGPQPLFEGIAGFSDLAGDTN